MKSRNAARILTFFLAIIFILINTSLVWGTTTSGYTNSSTDSISDRKEAASYVLIEASRGQVLSSRNPDEKLHISVACKLMTILIALENGKLNSNVTISKDALEATGSLLSLEVGKRYPLEDLLKAVMLTSANDAARAVAEHISEDIPSFIEAMNKKAQELKMENTIFTNPTGLYDENQYTTAADIAKMMQYAHSNASFRSLFALRASPWTSAEGDTTVLASPNKLFWSYEGITGGKIGYNVKELPSIVASATRNGMSLICIILDCPEETLYEDAARLLDFGFERFKRSVLVKSDDKLKTVTVANQEINLISGQDIYYVHPVGEDYISELSVTVNVEPPISKTKVAGTASFTLDDGFVLDVPLFPEQEIVPEESFFVTAKKALIENRDIFFLLCFLLAIELAILIIKLINSIYKRKTD
jgi:D-alanyl-D-alanine carboxypeptidase (penicillin-binding protein 5/6)